MSLSLMWNVAPRCGMSLPDVECRSPMSNVAPQCRMSLSLMMNVAPQCRMSLSNVECCSSMSNVAFPDVECRSPMSNVALRCRISLPMLTVGFGFRRFWFEALLELVAFEMQLQLGAQFPLALLKLVGFKPFKICPTISGKDLKLWALIEFHNRSRLVPLW